MSDAAVQRSAGALLREARRAQGLDVAALAAAIKVAPHKIEQLEADRFDDLHGVAYARALAQSVCRALHIDPAEVLSKLPQPGGERLDEINQGLNAPFRDRPGRMAARDWAAMSRPVVWGPALIIVAAAVLYLWPSRLVPPTKTVVRSLPAAGAPASEAVASQRVAAPPAAASAVETMVETVHSAPPRPEGSIGADPVPASPAGVLQLRTTSQSWVEVLDARGRLLISRVIQPGEAVGLDGDLPFRLRIGNAAGTQLTFRGETVDLGTHTRENVARFELR